MPTTADWNARPRATRTRWATRSTSTRRQEAVSKSAYFLLCDASATQAGYEPDVVVGTNVVNDAEAGRGGGGGGAGGGAPAVPWVNTSMSMAERVRAWTKGTRLMKSRALHTRFRRQRRRCTPQ